MAVAAPVGRVGQGKACGPPPERTDTRKPRIDGGGNGKAVVAVVGGVGDPGGKPVPKRQRERPAGQHGGQTRRITKGKIRPEQQAFAPFQGLAQHREKPVHRVGAGAVTAFASTRHADPDRIRRGPRGAGGAGGGPVEDGDAVEDHRPSAPVSVAAAGARAPPSSIGR